MVTSSDCFNRKAINTISSCPLCGRKPQENTRGTMTAWLFRKICNCLDASASHSETESQKAKSQTVSDLSGVQHPKITERYDVLEEIGAGGMGTVYKALDRQQEDHCAIKVLRSEFLNDRSFLQRFEREALACTSFRHPNLVHVRDHGYTASGAPFFVMEWLDGTALSSLLQNSQKLSADQTVRIGTEICAALCHIHQLGIIHRDLKPNNIVLARDESGLLRAKLVDFGIAKVNEASSSNLTETGEIFGSPLYMSPEQCTAEELDSRSDIYSLGCVLFECLTGKPPFLGANALETIMMHLLEKPEATTSICPALLSIVLKCLEKDAARRYQSAAALCIDLNRVLDRSWSLRLRGLVLHIWRSRKLHAAATLGTGVLTAAMFFIPPVSVGPDWDTYNQEAQKAFDSGNYLKARDLFARALNCARLQGNVELASGTAQDLHDVNAAIAGVERKNLAHAKSIAKKESKLEDLSTRTIDDEQSASSLVKKALYAEKDSEIDTARSAYERALQIYALKRRIFVKERALALSRLADLIVIEGNFLARAQSLIEESRRVNRIVYGPQSECVAENSLALAECLMAQGKGQEALAELNAAADFFERAAAGQLPCLARLAYLKGSLCADQNQLELALKYYESGKVHDRFHHARTLLALAALRDNASGSPLSRRGQIIMARLQSQQTGSPQ